MRLLYMLPVGVFVILAAILALGLERDPGNVPSALLDKPVPDFRLPALKDDKPGLTTADLKGKVQVVNFFASWCVPCRAEHPQITSLAEMGVAVHGVAYKDQPHASKQFLQQLGDPYTQIGLDLKGRAGIEWGVYGIPETYVIDRNGVIRYKQVGPIDKLRLAQEIAPLIQRLQQQ